MEKPVYLLNDNIHFSFNNNFVKVKKSYIVNNDIVDGFIGNINYFLYKNRIIYFIEILEKNNYPILEIDYDTIIYTNNDLVNNYTVNFDYINKKYDNYFIENYDFETQMWYFYYFKKGIDILNLVNSFQKLQNINIIFYIGDNENYINDNYVKMNKNVSKYFHFIFGKYNIALDEIINIFTHIIICMYKNKYISVEYIFNLFKNYDFMILFMERLYKEVPNIFYSETSKLKMKLDCVILNIIMIYFYSRYYIYYIYDLMNKINIKDFNDLLYFKKLYIFSMADLKINEFIYLHLYYKDILKKNDLIRYNLKNIMYDFAFVENKIVLIKNKSEEDDVFKFIKNKYNFLIL